MRKKELAKLVIERLKEAYPKSHCTLDYDDGSCWLVCAWQHNARMPE